MQIFEVRLKSYYATNFRIWRVLIRKMETILHRKNYIEQKMKLPIKDFLIFLRIWSHLLKKFLMEIAIFCAVRKNLLGQ